MLPMSKLLLCLLFMFIGCFAKISAKMTDEDREVFIKQLLRILLPVKDPKLIHIDEIEMEPDILVLNDINNSLIVKNES